MRAPNFGAIARELQTDDDWLDSGTPISVVPDPTAPKVLPILTPTPGPAERRQVEQGPSALLLVAALVGVGLAAGAALVWML